MRHSRSSASAFLRTAAEGGLCLSPHAGRGEAEPMPERTTASAVPYFSPTLNGSSLPGGTVSSAIARIIATIT